ncbi:MAG: DEAD/DEAH box helicase family protein, partial [Planctomycetota bacterium]
MIEIRFEDGTLVVTGATVREQDLLAAWLVRDERIQAHRAACLHYAVILRALHAAGIAYEDQARAYDELTLHEAAPRPLRPYQQAALDAWLGQRKRGVVVLPTGAGKSYVALRAMLATQRSALVLVPTIDLVNQWADDLEER